MSNSARAFLAVAVPPAVRDRCVAVQRSLAESAAGVKWVEPENLHVTLHFLGEVDLREVHTLCRAVADACRPFAPFALAVEGVGAYPTVRRPRTVWAGVADGAEELKAVHAALERPLSETCHYRREDREYAPHLTLGRVRGDRDGEPLAAAIPKFSSWRGGEAKVGEVLVMESRLSREGPIYVPLGRAPLSGRR